MHPLFVVLPLLAPPPNMKAPERHIDAARTNTPIKVDGVGDEPVWSVAPVADGFQERQPDVGAEPPVRTSFQVAYDDNNLYFLVKLEAEPGDLFVRTLQRDNFGIFSDDAIAIKIDPHFDRRTGMTFAINADGAQVETLNLEDGRVNLSQWDAVWEAETVKHEEGGYTAEFRIPLYALGVKGGEDVTMGLDITRDHQSRNATYDWRVIIPPRSPVSASSYGTLGGLKNIQGQRALEFLPYLAVNTDFSPGFRIDPRRSPVVAAGGEARIQVGTGSYVEASVLTDFAQVEADAVQVARDRFPLFFPERRPFFINGLDVFNFGREREGQLFFSRRIGLDGGSPVPIAAGAKAYGRAGPVSYGFLNVQTLQALPRDPADDVEDAGVPPENYSVGRVRVQTGQYASVGVLGLGRHRFIDDNNDAFSGGVDGEIRALKGKLRSYAFAATTWFEDPGSEEEVDDDTGEVTEEAVDAFDQAGASGYFTLDYQGLFVRPNVLWLYSSDTFESPLGFYQRPGTARQAGQIQFAPRPGVLGLRDIVFGPRVSITTDPNYEAILTRDWATDLRINWQRGWQIRYTVANRKDDVQDAFTLYLHEIEADTYQGFRHSVGFQGPRREAVVPEINYFYSEDFGGQQHQLRGQLRLRLSKHFSFQGTYTHRLGYFQFDRDADFNFGFANGTVIFAFTRDIIFDNLIRYSFEPQNERFGLQSRLRWRYLPGSDIFLVFRTDQPLGLEVAGEEPRSPFYSLTLKATFYFRALLKK